MRAINNAKFQLCQASPPFLGRHRLPTVGPLDDAGAAWVVDSATGLRYEYEEQSQPDVQVTARSTWL